MSTIVNFLHHLANHKVVVLVARYTGGTKTGVKRLSND
ncbi:MAG: YigZ family protein [Bacteroidales bacterium]|nr:YigZ family protein [Bacteroidales bacterium]